MNIKELKEKYANALPDRTLIRDLEIALTVKFIPEQQLLGEYIILEDESGILEAATSKQIFEHLKNKIGKNLKLKGRLDKTEIENIVFDIEEILE